MRDLRSLSFLPKKTEKVLYTIYFFSMVIGIFLLLFNFEPYLDPNNPVVAALNSIRGISAASSIKILGTHILWNGWAGSRNIFWRKKLVPKFGRYKYFLYCDVVPKCIMVILIGWLPVYKIADEVMETLTKEQHQFRTYNHESSKDRKGGKRDCSRLAQGRTDGRTGAHDGIPA